MMCPATNRLYEKCLLQRKDSSSKHLYERHMQLVLQKLYQECESMEGNRQNSWSHPKRIFREIEGFCSQVNTYHI